MTASKSIVKKIQSLEYTAPFTPSLFVGLGSRAAIDQTLMRLAKEGVIERIGRGLYMRPKATPFGFSKKPTHEEIVRAIAQEEGAKIEIHGAEAARRLGLSTQTPLKPIYLTTGSSRRLKLGNLVVELKNVSPRSIELAGTQAGEALSAMKYLGAREVNESTFAKLATRLHPAQFEQLIAYKSKMPAWMAKSLLNYERLQHEIL